jgi:peptidoglycan hydrolase-like protein with peptidoglycan-binding domain
MSSRRLAVASHGHGAPPAAPGRPTPARRDPITPAPANHVAQRLLRHGVLRAKLTVSQAGDPFEEEADRAADTVMRMAATPATVGGASPQPRSIQRRCSACEDDVQRKPATPGADAAAHQPAPGADLAAPEFRHPSSGGRPLSDSDRRFFEPRFGRDLSTVRIHTGDQAAQAARSVNARAFTIGNEVVFGAGEYRPGAEDGKRLLAHELAHTLQQAGPGTPAIRRKLNDGHDLNALEFAGNLILEAVYDAERELKEGDKGAGVSEAVSKLQQALISAVPRSGFRVTGKFGPETTLAVRDFQRASGLGGGPGQRLDGVVDAITMGWLDQRFSTKPTPPGKKLGATPGCPAFKTVTVDLVSLDGSTRYMFGDFRRAISIFNQCCVRFEVKGGGFEDAARTRGLLGGDTVLETTDRVGDRTAEEIAMFNGATADFKLSGRIRAFFVASTTPTPDPYSIPPFAAKGTGAALKNMVVIPNTASDRGLAHEFGHVLLNRGNAIHAEMEDPEYLMSYAFPNPGERITPDQCVTIFANA